MDYYYSSLYVLGLFSPLLRLLATHFPHLSLVDDWMEDEDQHSSTQDSAEQTDAAIEAGTDAIFFFNILYMFYWFCESLMLYHRLIVHLPRTG